MLWIRSHTKHAVNNGQLSSMNVLQVVCQKPHYASARKYSRYLDRDKWMYRPGSWRYFGSFTGKDSPGTLTC